MNGKITVIIAEDNKDAQEIMVSFLEPLHHFEVIGIANNGESLLELNLNLKPHVIIADINMPILNGIEAIHSCLHVNPEVKVIYTTAYDQYAVKAFDLNAVDYLMKPIKKERLYVALEKAKSVIQPPKKVEENKIVTIKMDRASYFIHCSDIIFVEKENRKTIIHTMEQTYETYESLDSISKKLTSTFFRTHRSFIVNLDYISHIILEGETYLVYFRNNYSHYAHVSKLRINELYKSISHDVEYSN